MKKNVFCGGIVGALLLATAVCPLFAAEDPARTVKAPASKPQPAASGTFPGKDAAESALPGGQNVEKLLYTLNETLQENRRIRQSLRDLQEAFEKVTLEKSDMEGQIRKAEQLSIQRSKEAGQKADELTVELEDSKKEIEKLQAANKAAADQQLELQKKLEGINAENAKIQGLLKDAVLAPERDSILERMKENDAVVLKTVGKVSSMDGENVALKQRLIQSCFDLGNVFYDLGRYEDAAGQYLRILEWDPYHAWAHHNLGVIYDFHLRQYIEARKHYQEYLRLKLPSEEAQEVRMRLWDLTQLSKVTPEQPLRKDFNQYQRMPRG